MTYRLILLLGCVPLVTLTVFSLLDPAPPESAVPSSGDLLARTSELIEETKPRLNGDRGLVGEMVESDLPLESINRMTPAGTKSLDAVRDAVRQGQRARELLSSLTVVSPRSPAAPPTLEEWLKSVSAWVKLAKGLTEERPKYVPSVPGADAIFRQLQGRIEQGEEEVAAVQLLLEAYRHFYNGAYGAALAKLKQIPADRIKDERKRLRIKARIEVYRRWVLYFRDRGLLGDMGSISPKTLGVQQARVAFAQFNAFLETYPSAPEGVEPTTHERHKEIAKKRGELRARMDYLAWEQQLRADVSAFSSAETLSEFSSRADRIAERLKDPRLSPGTAQELRGRCSAAVTEWLTSSAFPLKKPPEGLCRPGIREVEVRRNATRCIGTFEYRQGFQNVEFTRWNAKLGEPVDFIPVDNLPPKEKLEPPKYVSWADDYNKRVTRICTAEHNTDDRTDHWRSFLDWCEKTDKEVHEYRARWSAKQHRDEADEACKDWNFLPDKKRLPHRRLEDLSEQLEKLTHIFGP